MNRIFKTVFNKSIGAWVAVPEFAKGRVKTSGHGASIAVAQSETKTSQWLKLSALATALLLFSGQCAFALPTGMAVPNNPKGATITASNPTTTELDVRSNYPTDDSTAIKAGAPVVTLDWNGGFNIAKGESVKFIDTSNGLIQGWINVDTSGHLSTIAGAVGGYTQDTAGNLTASSTPIVDIVVSTNTEVVVSGGRNDLQPTSMIGNTLFLNVASDQKPLQVETATDISDGDDSSIDRHH